MSYNIFNKNASFQGTAKGESGSVEYLVDTHTDQSIVGAKTFNGPLTSSTGLDFGAGLISGSGKVSASFFYGDGAGLSGVATAAGTDRQVQFNNGGSALGASSTFTFTAANQLQVTGQISASLGVSGSEFHGDGSNLTAVTASFVTASNVVGVFDTSKITTGTFADARIPNLDTAKITTGTFADARISEASVTRHEGALAIAGGQLTGDQSILNARLQNTVYVQNVTASGHMSASTFHGDGTALTGVTSTPTPAGSNTQIQFNADGAIAADADLTFLTGSNTLATSNVSASVNISGSSLYLQDEIYVGGQAFLDIETNVAANNASFTEVTASSTISSSADVYGANFRGNGSTLNNVPLGTYANSNIVFCDNTPDTITSNSDLQWTGTHLTSTGISASADVQVGGHITGSGDIVLLGTGNSIIFDKPAGDGPLITAPSATELILDGDNFLKLRSDSFVTIQHNTTDKFNFNLTDDKMVTAMLLSSSAAVSASIFDSLTGYKLGDQTVIDSDGNFSGNNAWFNEITASSVISSSADISASVFHGDGSQLTGISVRTINIIHNSLCQIKSSRNASYIRTDGNGNVAASSTGFSYIAPNAGRIDKVVATPMKNSSVTGNDQPEAGDEIVFYMNKNLVDTNPYEGLNASLHCTSSDTQLEAFTFTYGGTTSETRKRLIYDFTIGSPEPSGSRTFGAGDHLCFGIYTDSTINNIAISILLSFD